VLSLLLHVKRHYAPDDRVLAWDAEGTVTRLAPVPGATTMPGLVVYRFAVGIFYANASRLSEEVIGLVDGDDPPRWLILVADGVDDLDFTGGKTLLELAGQLERRGVVFAIAEASPKVRRELDRFGVTSRIGREHVYATLDDALAGFHRAGESGPRVAEPV